jgi:hypothetical protein
VGQKWDKGQPLLTSQGLLEGLEECFTVNRLNVPPVSATQQEVAYYHEPLKNPVLFCGPVPRSH